jgi:hypothetical protein
MPRILELLPSACSTAPGRRRHPRLCFPAATAVLDAARAAMRLLRPRKPDHAVPAPTGFIPIVSCSLDLAGGDDDDVMIVVTEEIKATSASCEGWCVKSFTVCDHLFIF